MRVIWGAMELPILESDFPPQWDPDWVAARRRIEGRRSHSSSGWRAEDGIHLPFHYRFLKWSLQAAGLYARGYRNYSDVRIRRLQHFPAGWPKALDGFRILQLSDLHIDLDPALQPVIRRLLPTLACDLAVITGDFWEGAGQHPEIALGCICEILQLIVNPSCGTFGIPGNHDTLALAAALEEMGLPLLINRAVCLGAGPAKFALAGIDDAFYFRTHDLQRAAAQCPPGLPRILLSHSPQVALAALAAGFCLMLSGHTHGGQVCLPGGLPLVHMERIPTPLFRGLWKKGSLISYTSTGTGSCHVPVRFNCPPEIVIHTLNASV